MKEIRKKEMRRLLEGLIYDLGLSSDVNLVLRFAIFKVILFRSSFKSFANMFLLYPQDGKPWLFLSCRSSFFGNCCVISFIACRHCHNVFQLERSGLTIVKSSVSNHPPVIEPRIEPYNPQWDLIPPLRPHPVGSHHSVSNTVVT